MNDNEAREWAMETMARPEFKPMLAAAFRQYCEEHGIELTNEAFLNLFTGKLADDLRQSSL